MNEDSRSDLPEVAEHYLKLLQAGSAPSREEFLKTHPDASGALSRRLVLLDIMHRATMGSGVGSGTRSSAAGSSRGAPCPHCGHAISAPPKPLEGGEMTCTACGKSFPLDAIAPPVGKARDTPVQIGRFRILSLLGRGSFGAVYKAKDSELGRAVAIKVPRASQFTSPDEEQRFLREARSAALLHHPGIVHVYEVAEERGMPYIVSEYIEGGNLADRIAAGLPGSRESAEMTAHIADALHFAHQAKVIHRDIKPGNILLDAAGGPHIADFGLARHDEDKAAVTLDGQVIGTPAYMSPEQAMGDTRKVDARCDVYSLGVVLYELLCGERPFRGSRAQILQQVLHDEPRQPRTLHDQVPRDLETICLKAMAKEPVRRYPTAAELAADLRRFLEGRPILARPVGRAERLLRWSRRNPVVAGLTCAVTVLLIAIAAVSSTMAYRTSRARDEANERLSRLNVATGFRLAQEGDLFGALPWFAEARRRDMRTPSRDEIHRLRFESVLERCPKLTHVWPPASTGSDRVLAFFHPDGKRIVMLRQGRASIVDTSDDARGELLLPPADVQYVAFNPDGRSAATCSSDGAVRLWDASTGAPIGKPFLHGHPFWHAAFSGDGRLLVTSSVDHTARVWDVDSQEAIGPPLAHRDSVMFASFDPAGHRVVTASADGTAIVWSVPGGSRLAGPLTHAASVQQAAFSPDGSKVATASFDNTATIWDAETGQALTPPLRHRHYVVDVSFSPDGLRLLTASYDGTAVVWNAETGVAVTTIEHNLGVPSAGFSPDGREVLTANFDGTACVWSASNGQALTPPLHHAHNLDGAIFSPEGRRVLTSSNDGTIRLWDLAGGEWVPARLRHQGGIVQAAFDSRGERALTVGNGGTVQIWNASTGEQVAGPVVHSPGVSLARFSLDGKLVVTCSNDGTVRFWDACTCRDVGGPLQHARAVHRFDLSPDGLRIATACEDGFARVWSLADRKPIGQGLRHPAGVAEVAFSPDGRRLLTACKDGAARIWDLETEKVVAGPMQHGYAMSQASFSPDGTRVATSGTEQSGKVWDAATGLPVTPPMRHNSELFTIEFSHDGSRVVTASWDGTGRVWSARTGEPITPLLKHRGLVIAATFSVDDRLVATSSTDSTVIVWDAETGEEVTLPFKHKGGSTRAAFNPNGKQLLTAGGDGFAVLWRLPSGDRPPADEALLSLVLSGRRIDATGGFVRVPAPEFDDAWRMLHVRYGSDLAPSPDEVLAWREEQAAEDEAARRWESAAAHLSEVLKQRPRDLSLHLRRAIANGWLGRLEEASADFAMAIDLGSAEASQFYSLSLARLGTGDLPGAHRAFEAMMARFGDAYQPLHSNELAWTSVMIPCDAADLARGVAAARRAVAGSPRNSNYRNTLGAVLYRAGDYESAVTELEESVALQKDEGNAFDWIFLSMSHQRLGHAEAAERYLAMVEDWAAKVAAGKPAKLVPGEWTYRVEIRMLLAEAKELAAGK